MGNAGLAVMPEGGNVFETDLGYFLNPRFAKQGYMSEAVRCVLEAYFKDFDAIQATVHPDNKSSVRLLEKMGGKQVKFETNSYRNHEPRLYMTIEKEDFQKIQ